MRTTGQAALVARLGAAVVLATVLLSGCEARVQIGIAVGAGGGGEIRLTVTLDKEAAGVGDLRRELRVADLQEAGWRLRGPERTDDGGLEVELRHSFRRPDELPDLVAQLDHGAGLFRDFRVARDRSFSRTTTRFEGTIDLTAGIEAFGDQGLRDRLGGSSVDVAELQRRANRPLERIFPFRVALRLPGTVESNAPTHAGSGVVWQPKLGERVELRASARRTNTANIALAVVSVVSALALAGLLVARSRVRRRRVNL